MNIELSTENNMGSLKHFNGSMCETSNHCSKVASNLKRFQIMMEIGYIENGNNGLQFSKGGLEYIKNNITCSPNLIMGDSSSIAVCNYFASKASSRQGVSMGMQFLYDTLLDDEDESEFPSSMPKDRSEEPQA